MFGLESAAIVALVAIFVAYALWRERRSEKDGRKQPFDGGYVSDSGGGWGSGWGGDSCGGGDGGGCGGGGD